MMNFKVIQDSSFDHSYSSLQAVTKFLIEAAIFHGSPDGAVQHWLSSRRSGATKAVHSGSALMARGGDLVVRLRGADSVLPVFPAAVTAIAAAASRAACCCCSCCCMAAYCCMAASWLYWWYIIGGNGAAGARRPAVVGGCHCILGGASGGWLLGLPGLVVAMAAWAARRVISRKWPPLLEDDGAGGE